MFPQLTHTVGTPHRYSADVLAAMNEIDEIIAKTASPIVDTSSSEDVDTGMMFSSLATPLAISVAPLPDGITSQVDFAKMLNTMAGDLRGARFEKNLDAPDNDYHNTFNVLRQLMLRYHTLPAYTFRDALLAVLEGGIHHSVPAAASLGYLLFFMVIKARASPSLLVQGVDRLVTYCKTHGPSPHVASLLERLLFERSAQHVSFHSGFAQQWLQTEKRHNWMNWPLSCYVNVIYAVFGQRGLPESETLEQKEIIHVLY
jgi:hypothetical protein